MLFVFVPRPLTLFQMHLGYLEFPSACVDNIYKQDTHFSIINLCEHSNHHFLTTSIMTSDFRLTNAYKNEE